jgi:hypothetical protein
MLPAQLESLTNKPAEYWAILCGMVFYVVMRDAERETILRRMVKTVTSALLAYGLSPALSTVFNGSENVAVIAVMSLGLITLDTASAIFSEKDFVRKVFLRFVGFTGGSEK